MLLVVSKCLIMRKCIWVISCISFSPFKFSSLDSLLERSTVLKYNLGLEPSVMLRDNS